MNDRKTKNTEDKRQKKGEERWTNRHNNNKSTVVTLNLNHFPCYLALKNNFLDHFYSEISFSYLIKYLFMSIGVFFHIYSLN